MTQLGTDFRVLAIHTPEGVRFDIPLAGPTVRFLAWFMDALVIYGAVAACAQCLHWIQVISPDLGRAIIVILVFVLNIGYPIALEWMLRGQTIGKRVFGLRVIDATGKRLELTQIMLRNLLRFVDLLPLLYLVGGASLVLTKRCQRLGDMVANTVVIRQRKLVLPYVPDSRNSQQFNSLLNHPHLAARLRQTVPPALTQVALEAILRRDELASDARIAVFRSLAQRFKSLVTFPDESLAGMAEERYVRNCLEIVLSTGNLRRHVHADQKQPQ
jgi:uncharacterized RDD family membrane protein YckC